jgi:hypothetical protein
MPEVSNGSVSDFRVIMSIRDRDGFEPRNAPLTPGKSAGQLPMRPVWNPTGLPKLLGEPGGCGVPGDRNGDAARH